MTAIPLEDVPLKQRFYYYRGKVPRFLREAHTADELYWSIRNAKRAAKKLAEASQ
jgi:hypothetical protein